MEFLSLLLSTFVGAFAAFSTNRLLDQARKYQEKIVSGNLALITLKNQCNEFLLFRRSFYLDVDFVSKGTAVPVWALIRPAFLSFGKYEIDFKSIGFLLTNKENGKLFDIIELAQISHRDLIAMNDLRTINAQIIQQKISDFEKDKPADSWLTIEREVGGNLISLMRMLAIGMALRAEENELVYSEAISKFRAALEKNLDGYWPNQFKKFLGLKVSYALIEVCGAEEVFRKENLPKLPDNLLNEVLLSKGGNPQ